VKLLGSDKQNCVFLVGKREREMMTMLLRMYPLLGSDYHEATRDGSFQIDADLLEEALADQHRANKEALEEFLTGPGRFIEHELGYRFNVKRSEMEWLLQLFNDVRVGSWVKLGSPDPRESIAPKLTEENVQLAWAMEMAGLFEHQILEALDSA
jgi:hypothetical protein